MKRLLIISFLLFVLMATCFTEETEHFVQINLDIGYSFYDEIKKTGNNVGLGFYNDNITYEHYGKRNVIKKINYYLIKGKNRVFLGSLDKNGVYDKDNVIIKKCPFLDTEQVKNIGLPASILDDPFSPAIVVNRKGHIEELDPYSEIRINFKTQSLIIEDLVY